MTGKLRNYLLAGIFTVIPVWITWIVFSFIVTRLSNLGQPSAVWLSNALDNRFPALTQALLHPWFQNVMAVFITLLALVILGWAATRVVGGRIIASFDGLIQRIPLIEKIYGSTKALVSALQHKPGEVQRVVLIEFPNSQMKTIGFVTRVIADRDTGDRLAAVYVPTTPNPTSGYMEIVPMDRVVETDWTMDQAMSFVISGGTHSPDSVNYHRSADTAKGDSERLREAP